MAKPAPVAGRPPSARGGSDRAPACRSDDRARSTPSYPGRHGSPRPSNGWAARLTSTSGFHLPCRLSVPPTSHNRCDQDGYDPTRPTARHRSTGRCIALPRCERHRAPGDWHRPAADKRSRPFVPRGRSSLSAFEAASPSLTPRLMMTVRAGPRPSAMPSPRTMQSSKPVRSAATPACAERAAGRAR